MLCGNLYGDFFPTFFNKENTQKNRVEYVRNLTLAVKNLKNNIPTISPKEEEWVKSELQRYHKTQNSSIYWNLKSKDSYKFFKIHEYLDMYIGLLKDVTKSKTVADEVLRWALVADFNNFNKNIWSDIYELNEKGLFEKTLIMPKNHPLKGQEYTMDDIDLNNRITLSEYIFRFIVIPHLNKIR
jgi:hypothetical protein